MVAHEEDVYGREGGHGDGQPKDKKEGAERLVPAEVHKPSDDAEEFHPGKQPQHSEVEAPVGRHLNDGDLGAGNEDQGDRDIEEGEVSFVLLDEGGERVV